jgi:hypothetical protein
VQGAGPAGSAGVMGMNVEIGDVLGWFRFQVQP